MKQYTFKDGTKVIASSVEEAKAKHQIATAKINKKLVDALQKDKNAEIKFNGFVCPICGSKYVYSDEIYHYEYRKNPNGKLGCECDECGSSWKLNYQLKFGNISDIKISKSGLNEVLKEENQEEYENQLTEKPKKLPVSMNFKTTSMRDTTSKRKLVYETIYYNKGKAKKVWLTVKYKGQTETFSIDASKITVQKKDRATAHGKIKGDIVGKVPGFREWAEKTFNVPKFSTVWDFVIKIVIK